MPRPLVYGNGRLLIAFDHRHQAKDLFWPNVGYPNHLLGHTMRVGVWVDDALSWCDSDDWEREQTYLPRSLVGSSLWRSWNVGLELEVIEAVDPERPVFVRSIRVRDLRGLNRKVKLFFTQNFILGQSDVGNTAFYNPFCDAVFHYRGPFYAIVSGRSSDKGIDQYATGLTGFGGMEGTWKDAEDGELSSNPIAQGSVDSTFAVDAADGETVEFVLVTGATLDDSAEEFGRGWASVAERSKEDSTKWLAKVKAPSLNGLSTRIQELFWQSLLIVRSQIDAHGAVVAANDSDILATNRATYSYCWPRDGACVVRTLSRLGLTGPGDRFAEFCGRVVSQERPCFLQKYRSDGSLGASWHPWVIEGRPMVPFQEDETALVVLSIWEATSKPVRKSAWESYGRRAAQFLAEHQDEVGLPLPSWDLWEERFGVHFWTACSVVAGLRAAGHIAKDLGEDARPFIAAANKTRAAIEDGFFDGNLGRYLRKTQDETLDSSVLGGLLLLGDDPDERWVTTIAAIEEGLAVDGPIGGLARYDADYYFRTNESGPGNPWVISTMWLASIHRKLGNRQRAVGLLEWVADRAESTFVLSEQYHPESGRPLSVSPLTWSHAAFLDAVLDVASG